MEHTSYSGLIPGFIEDMTTILDDRGVQTEGVYRVPGHKDRVTDMVTKYFTDNLRERIQPHQIDSERLHDCSSALKQFLRELDEPLMTFPQYDPAIAACKAPDPEQKSAKMADVIGKLPVYNFHTLKHLMEHLRRIAAAQEITRLVWDGWVRLVNVCAWVKGEKGGFRSRWPSSTLITSCHHIYGSALQCLSFMH